MMEKTLAYLAGYIDADGYIGLGKRKAKWRESTYTVYTPFIKIISVDLEIPQLAKELFGGSIQAVKRPLRRTLYRWSLDSKSACQLAETLLPYLVLKQLRAKVLVEYAKTLRAPGEFRIPADRWELRENMYLAVRALNKRGQPSLVGSG